MLAYAAAKHLTQSGYDVVAVNGTMSAMEVLDSGRHVDLVLADIVMPAGRPNPDLAVDGSGVTGKRFYKPLDFESLRTGIAALLAA